MTLRPFGRVKVSTGISASVRVAAGRSLDRYGQPMTIKLSGTVEPYFQDVANAEDAASDEQVADEPEA